MPCVICGSDETIKSHIVPRGLFHASKRPGKQIIGNKKGGEHGYRYLQSGFWDNTILCAAHEAALGKYDDYGIGFCKEFLRLRRGNALKAEVPNPDPYKLVQFVGACVWRFAVSRSKGRPHKTLGPYAKKLEDALFNGIKFDPLLLISQHGFRDREGYLNMASLPYVYSEEGIRFWRFISCGIVFDLKLDNRRPPPAMKTLGVNDQATVTIYEDFSQSPMRDQALAPAFFAMAAGLRQHRKKK